MKVLNHYWASQVVLVVKNLPATAGALRGTCSIPSWGRSPGAGLGNSLQYSCLENPMHRGGWWATVHSVTKSRAWVKQLSMNIWTIITSNHFSVLFSVLCLISQFKHVSLVFELIPSTWTLVFELQFLNFLFLSFFLSFFLLLLHRVFVPTHGLSLVVASMCYRLLPRAGFSLPWLSLLKAQALGVQTSVVTAHRLSSCDSQALECRLRNCSRQV